MGQAPHINIILAYEVNKSINGLCSNILGQEWITALKNQVEELFWKVSGKGKQENVKVNRPIGYNIYILRIQEREK